MRLQRALQLLLLAIPLLASSSAAASTKRKRNGHASSSPRFAAKAFAPRRALADQDFVHATSTHAGRYALARASRAWRLGSIRSFVVVNNRSHVEGLNRQGAAHLERYASWHEADAGGALAPAGDTSSRGKAAAPPALLWSGGAGRQGNVTALLSGPGLALAPAYAHA